MKCHSHFILCLYINENNAQLILFFTLVDDFHNKYWLSSLGGCEVSRRGEEQARRFLQQLGMGTRGS